MRVVTAIEDFLGQMAVERDFTARSLGSYRSVLNAIPDALGDEVTMQDLDGRAGTEKLRRIVARRWGGTSAARRAGVISILHSFGAWGEEEGHFTDDPARRLKRPPRRRANVYRPPRPDIDLCYRVLAVEETAPWILMHRIGLRASTVCSVQWGDLDLVYGWVDVTVKGGHKERFPIPPDALDALHGVVAILRPDNADYLFVATRQLEHGNQGRRAVRDPRKPATQKTLWVMVTRICDRAGVRRFGPHALRHAFATEFLRDSDRDVMSLQRLLGHTRLETTRGYVEDLTRVELEDAVRRAAGRRLGVTDDDATSVAEPGDETIDEGEGGLEAADGPGRNRTSAGRRSAENAGRNRVGSDDEPSPATPKGGHK